MVMMLGFSGCHKFANKVLMIKIRKHEFSSDHVSQKKQVSIRNLINPYENLLLYLCTPLLITLPLLHHNCCPPQFLHPPDRCCSAQSPSHLHPLPLPPVLHPILLPVS